MKHILAVSLFFIVLGLIYAAFAFTTWQSDPSKWVAEARGISCFFGLCLGFAAVIFVEFDL